MDRSVIGYSGRMPPHPDTRTEISGRYRLRSEIGRGGMGTVWHAEDTLLKRDVAIKEIELPDALAAEEHDPVRKRVLREARAAAALNHANAVTVFDVIEEDGNAFIVMEHIAGRTLAEIVTNEGPIPDERLSAIATDVLSALEIAHASGIVHRDVKPANVMITDDGRTKLADFGIASVKDDPKITASGLILGSPSYMAPEQATHGSGGPEADLWGLGATLYFGQEGVPPFEKQGPIPTLTAVVGEEPRPMERPGKLRPAIDALLSKDPSVRPPIASVRAMVAGSRPHPTPSQHSIAGVPTAHMSATPSRRPWGWIAGIAVLALVVVLGTLVVTRQQETNVPADRAEQKDGNPSTDEDVPADAALAVPAAWTTYTDPEIGYTIAYPEGWSIEVRDEQNTLFHAPDGSFLQIGWRSPPDEAGPVGAWKEYEPSFASRQDDYERIAIQPTEFKRMEAGWWEMTYEGLHAVNLGFITPDEEYGMALFFNTPESKWDESQSIFERFRASFRPPA